MILIFENAIITWTVACLVVLVVSYLLGSISSSIIITKMYKMGDIRDYGSGNAGATNVLRTVGKKASALTFLFDFLKCVIAVVLGRLIISYIAAHYGLIPEVAQFGAYAAGLSCMMGHMYPIYYGFKGGKGIVTSAALIALVDWRVFIVVFSIFLLMMFWKKIVSLSSIIGIGLYPAVTFLINFFFNFEGSPINIENGAPLYYLISITVISLIISVVIITKHSENIKRLIKGTEKPISFTKTDKRPK